MPGRIPRTFIDELVARVDIVEVIDERVPLKKAGRDFVACCPFHEEKTPSFSVSQSKQFYYCFGCGARGTAIGFLMDYAQLDFPEAVAELAQRVGMTVPHESGPDAQQRAETAGLYDVLEKASLYFRRQLREHPEASKAVEYLKSRGLSGETAARFGLGFAPPGWNGLMKTLGAGAEQKHTLLRAGLLVEKNANDGYDRFRNRIMFPIRDRRGRVIGFGARAIGDESPKYLNSPETPVFHKGQELYGHFEARQANRQLDRLFVVEGYMDVVALSQFGIDNAVATLGTAATTDHVNRLFRTTPNVIFCFDGDSAGRRAAWRAAETLLPAFRDGWLASFMFLPDGEDPDSLVRKEGARGFLSRADEAVPLSSFLFDHLAEDVDMTNLEGRARYVERARPLLNQITEAPAFLSLVRQRLRQVTGMDSPELSKLIPQRERAPRQAAQSRPAGQRNSPSLVRRAITLLLHHPELGQSSRDTRTIAELKQPGITLLVSLLDLTRSSPELTTSAIVERYRSDKQGQHLAKLVAESSPELEDGLAREFTDTLAKLEQMVDEQRFEALTAKANASALTDEEELELKRLVNQPGGGSGSRH